MHTPLLNNPIDCPQKDCPSPVRSFLSRFAREEDGVFLVFSVYVFLIILMIGGIGIDLMRYERDRSELQNTMDRAVLAAADLDQQQSPEAVVTDYFTKAGLSEYLTSITVDEGDGYRVVSGTATADIDTLFMHMTGVDTLSANTASTAEERIDGVEISLVLDVSGSMNSNSKLSNLKTAARDFIDEMVDNTEEGNLSISIIPYATQVSAPSVFFDEFNTTGINNHSNCINFESSDFLETGVDPTETYERTMFFDPWYTRDGRDDDPVKLITRPVCEAKASREMMILQKDAATLKTFISNLTATGNTSIDIGMKWGTALVDPGMRPVITDLITAGEVDSDFAGLPKAYEDNSTLKVIVLMTDGKNTSQYFINDGFRTGNTNVWWNEEQERYSIYDPGRDEYFVPDYHGSSSGDWEDHPYGDEESGDAVRLTFPALWANTSIKWNRKYNYAPWSNSSWDDWYYDVRNYVGTSTKNARTKNICDAAKAEQIIVFTIGFEAPSSGEAVLSDCASSPSHFFDVDGLEINDAFASIASSIRKLRLTQ